MKNGENRYSLEKALNEAEKIADKAEKIASSSSVSTADYQRAHDLVEVQETGSRFVKPGSMQRMYEKQKTYDINVMHRDVKKAIIEHFNSFGGVQSSPSRISRMEDIADFIMVAMKNSDVDDNALVEAIIGNIEGKIKSQISLDGIREGDFFFREVIEKIKSDLKEIIAEKRKDSEK